MLLKTLPLKFAIPLLAIFAAGTAVLPRAVDTTNAGICAGPYPAYGLPACVNSSYNGSYYNTYDTAQYYSYSPAGHIFQTGQINANSGDPCVYTGYVQWDTANISYAEITVNDPDSGLEKVFASGPYGSSPAPWLQPGKTYVFNLVDLDNGQRLRLDAVQINLQGMSCAPVTANGYNGSAAYYNNPPAAYASGGAYAPSASQASNPAAGSGMLFNDWARQQYGQTGSQPACSSSPCYANSYPAAGTGQNSGGGSGILFNDWVRQNSQQYASGNSASGPSSAGSGILYNDWVRNNAPAVPGPGSPSAGVANNNSGIIYYNNSMPAGSGGGY